MKKDEFVTLRAKYIALFKEKYAEITASDTEDIKAYRAQAMAQLEAYEFDTQEVEKYRDSSIFEHITTDKELNTGSAEAKASAFSCKVPDLEAFKLDLLNGKFMPKSAADDGSISIQSITDNFNPRISEKKPDVLKLFNDLFFQSGYSIEVAANKVIDKKIQVTKNINHDNDLFINNKNRLVIGENSELNLVVCSHTEDDKFHLTNSVTEISLGKHSRLNILEVQSELSESSMFNSLYINQEENSKISHKIISLKGNYIRNNVFVDLDGEYAENEVSSMYLADHKQKVSNHVVMNHNAANCYSDQLFKGILDEYSSSVFTGRIYVKKDAQKTNAFQSNKNIILSQSAKAISKPQLEIYADDVKCSHGATIGEIDEQAVLYLKTRGIPENDAIHMLKFAFLNEVLEKIKIESIRNSVSGLVQRKLAREHIDCDTTC